MRAILSNWVSQLENPKQAEVIKARFGLGGKPKTLAAIGQDLEITRERVRQIEGSAINNLKVLEAPPVIRRIRDRTEELLNDTHGFHERSSLADKLKKFEVEPPHLHLIIITCPGLCFHKQTPHLNDFYYLKRLDVFRLKQLYDELHQHLEDKVLEEDVFLELLREKARRHLGLEFKERNLEEFLRVTRRLGRNQFNEVGHLRHPRIQLKTLKWKIKLILEKETEPLHFTAIHGQLIKHFGETANLQSVHNELIRSKDFVLAGRGLFALRGTGFDNRKVRDVLRDFLESYGPQKADACVKYVLGKKVVKRETVLATLYNSEYFKRVGEGVFDVR